MQGTGWTWRSWQRLGLSLGLGVGSFAPSIAAAQVDRPPMDRPFASPFAGQAGWHAMAASSALGMSALLSAAVGPALSPDAACVRLPGSRACDPSRLSGMDRPAVHADSLSWRRFSDVGQLTGILAPLLFPFADRLADFRGPASAAAWQATAEDVALAADVLALTNLLNELFKFAVRRPRPVNYRPDRRQTLGGQLSFPSGHTAAAAAGLACLCTTYSLRHSGPAHRWQRRGLIGLSGGLVLLTGTGRILGGRHFLSDVLAGGLLGLSFGVVLPGTLGHRLHLGPLMVDSAQLTPGAANSAALRGLSLETRF